MARYCMMCGERKNGLPVKNDWVLGAMRWFKANVTKNEKGNELVVCKECYPKYKKAREKFTTRQLLYVGIGVVFAVVSIIIAPHIGTVLAAIALIIFLYLLALLSYAPALELPKAEAGSRK